MYLPKIGESHSIAPLIRFYSAIFLGMVSILPRPNQVIISIGEFVATGEILLLYLPKRGDLHSIASFIRYYSAILLGIPIKTILTFCRHYYSFVPTQEKKCTHSPTNPNLIPAIRTLSTLPNLSHMTMLLLLMSPLFNVHYPSALNIHSSFSETPTLLLAQRRPIPIYILSIELHDRRRALLRFFPFCSFKTDCGIIYKPTFIDLHSPPCLNTLRYFSSFAMPICY